ncbi:hypothetical protein [Streptomyces sp. NPDC052701]|uniref:hypothetical protein n=1 Tax=Streptomyces sp. NPDC052701 TaxID=3155533 RepID=UPI003430766A
MNQASRQRAAASEIARLRGDVETFAAFLGQPAERFLNPGFISYATGISPERVVELLEGALPEVEPDTKDALEAFQRGLFQQRLRFLWQTRLKEGGRSEKPEPYKLRDIGAGTDISFQQVAMLLKGERAPNAAHAARLERFFDEASRRRTPKSRVPQGFCLRNEGAALIAYLTEMATADLPRLALASLATDLDTTSVSLRATTDAGDVDLVKLLPVLAQLRARARERDDRGD